MYRNDQEVIEVLFKMVLQCEIEGNVLRCRPFSEKEIEDYCLEVNINSNHFFNLIQGKYEALDGVFVINIKGENIKKLYIKRIESDRKKRIKFIEQHYMKIFGALIAFLFAVIIAVNFKGG